MGDAASAIPALRRATAPGAEDKALGQLAKDPQIRRQIENFGRAVAKATDVKAALRDPRVLNVLLQSFGLSDLQGQTGLLQRALTANPSETGGLLDRLPDKRLKATAQALGLSTRGLAALRDPKVQASLADGLRRQSRLATLDADQPGLSDAITFEGRAATARTAYDVLGDPVLRRVVTGALGLPQQIAVQPVETQARAITSRFDLAKLQNPKEVAKLAERYVVAAAGTADGATGATDPAAGLLALFA